MSATGQIYYIFNSFSIQHVMKIEYAFIQDGFF